MEAVGCKAKRNAWGGKKQKTKNTRELTELGQWLKKLGVQKS